MYKRTLALGRSTYNTHLGTPLVSKVPIDLGAGKLGCPDCECPLEPGLVPFYHKEHKLGAFDGIICRMCGYGLLTEKGYDESGMAIEAFGTVFRTKGFVDVIETRVTKRPHILSSTRVKLDDEETPSTRDAILQIPVITTTRQRKPAQMRFV